MMPKDFWINNDFVFFLHSDAKHLHLGHVTIEKIWWREPERARVVLIGPLPDAALLFDLKDGDSVLLLRKTWSSFPDEWSSFPDEFCADEVVMACRDCRIRRKWLLNLSPTFSEQEVVCIYVSLDCRFEIVDREAEKAESWAECGGYIFPQLYCQVCNISALKEDCPILKRRREMQEIEDG